LEVLRADLLQPAEWIDEAAAILNPGERAAFGRGTPAVARRRMVARIALRVVLADALGCSPQAVEIGEDAYGKPALASDIPLEFNLSHCGDCCLIAVSAVGPVGIDVEQVRPVPDLDEIAASRFTRGEASAIDARTGSDRLRAFLNCWTRKEAYLKAIGAGLAGGLDSVEVTVDDESPAIVRLEDGDHRFWSLSALELGSELIGAVALYAKDLRLPPRLRPTHLSPGRSDRPWP
jgi:4'-phosphopantetheinyl transferase